MKTKAFKLKENIARYIYQYIGRDDVSICFFNDTYSCDKLEIHLFGKTWEQHNDFQINRKRDELEQILGFGISICDCEKRRTLLWNKEKELKALKRVDKYKEREYILRSKNGRKGGIAYSFKKAKEIAKAIKESTGETCYLRIERK